MARPQTSTRDLAAITGRLGTWLAAQLGVADGSVTVGNTRGPGTAGFSSETMLFDASWKEKGVPRSAGYVLRMPPSADAFPLFPRYDLARQVRAMRLVRACSTVPVPAVPWYEPDSAALGAPFFIMEQVEGQVIADVPPYVFGGWLSEADPAQRARIREGAVEVLVGIHGIDADPEEHASLTLDAPGPTPLARHVANQRRYYDWLRDGHRFLVIERTFAWLEEHWPNEGEAVLSWGDARLANILWRDFDPVAVLDWEAVAVGPRELDLAWLIFFGEYFQRIAERYDRPGMPDLLRRDEVVARYAERSGHQPVDLDWYLVYAELRQALTSIRVSSRAVHFGDRPAPDVPDDLILQRDHLEGVLER